MEHKQTEGQTNEVCLMGLAFHNFPLHRIGCSIGEDTHKTGLAKDVLFFDYVREMKRHEEAMDDAGMNDESKVMK